MGIPFLKILAVLRALWPFPVWTSKDAVQQYLTTLAPPEADLISTLAQQWLSQGYATIELRGGVVVALVRDPSDKPCMADDDLKLLAAALDAEMPLPDGKWLDLIMKYLPLILELFGFFFKPAPDPAPDPTPVV
jgi:hypothetical protein